MPSSAGQKQRFLAAADWMVENLGPNSSGVPVWKHDFDWEYRTPLKAGWYSALAQGNALSLLVRAAGHTSKPKYDEAVREGLRAFTLPVGSGGVSYYDETGHVWFEETVVDPPTHILNGFIWALWGVIVY